ncbi:unnamed protein product [Closterium sp. NIES-53]
MTEAHGSLVPRQIVSIGICAAAAGLLAAAALAYYYHQRRQRREQRKADDGETVALLIAGSAVGDADVTDAREGGCAAAERGDETAIVAASVGEASPAQSGGGEGERGVLVVYCSQTGTARRLAGALVDELSRDGVVCQVRLRSRHSRGLPCMEATPSLACANKCVFCWRHHTNPVGKSWRWKVDEPEDIVEGALAGHVQMIKQMKGVPGVKPERLAEAMTPRHCALSLVGEPIMYPHINRLLALLHGRRISSFLVTNAQFPDKITHLHPVTQLYVSVDAGTKESLKAIDRPLFGDFWERFTASLSALRSKQQRTVYRLTLVTGWNTDELLAYAQLLKLGQPDFIEIKGVTYCGSTGASSLTMQNVPYHEDVRRFAAELGAAAGEAGAGEYELACEHEHSCCVLLALTSKFKAPDGTWHTWIDYEKFHELVASGQPFSSTDYTAPTPLWAVFGAKEAGFDPQETRVRRERKAGAV